MQSRQITDITTESANEVELVKPLPPTAGSYTHAAQAAASTTLTSLAPVLGGSTGSAAVAGDELQRKLGLDAALHWLLVRWGVGLLAFAALILAWWVVVLVGNYPPYILPTPADVGVRFLQMLADGSLLGHFWTTVVEAGLGFIAAMFVGSGLGYLIAHSRLLERVISPYIAVSQGLPVVALAPLLVIWVENDLARKVVIVALIVFFPVLVNTIVGIRSIDRSMFEVARLFGANWLQTIRYVELPLGLRSMLAGIKLGLTLSITGAVVGEFVSSGSGLGFLLILGRGQFDTALIFVGLVSLAALTTVSYSAVTLLEKALLTWDNSEG